MKHVYLLVFLFVRGGGTGVTCHVFWTVCKFEPLYDCSNHHNKTVGTEVGMHGRKVSYLKHVYLSACYIRFFSVRSAFCENCSDSSKIF